MPEVDRLSKTAIELFRKCPKQYWFSYVERAPKCFEPIEWKLGRAVHIVIANFLKELIGRLSPAPTITVPERSDWYMHWYENLTSDWLGELENGKLKIIAPTISLGDYIEHGRSCLRQFTEKILPHLSGWQIIEVEGNFTGFSIADVSILGTFDLVVTDGRNIVVYDWKTGKPRKDDEFQARLYFFAAKKKFIQHKANSMILKIVYLLPDYLDESASYDFSYDIYPELVAEVAEIKGAIEGRTDFEAKTSILCHWCPYGDLCEEGRSFILRNPLGAEGTLDEIADD